ncbi:MAG TPA: DUF2079 domain-containing protein [Acidimicrobiales bacterium]|nr:DUF2079 domain-containing protein [Acidimicrobiales bacterium]
MLTDIQSIKAGSDAAPSSVRPAGGYPTPTPVLLARVGLGLQLAWLIGFSVVEFLHDDLGYDFAIFFQAGWKISHGQLDPYSSIKGFPYWQNHGEAMMWLLAPLTRIPPYGLWLLVAQDLAAVALGWVLVDWVAHLARTDRWISALPRGVAVSVAALAILANPWVYLADAWDFHLQVFAVLALLLAARNFVDGRLRPCTPTSARTSPAATGISPVQALILYRPSFGGPSPTPPGSCSRSAARISSSS